MPSDSVPPRVTLRDIAKYLGVSHVTVSRALHNAPEVSATRREEIKEAAERMGYRPNPMAVALSVQRHEASAKPITGELAWLNAWPNPANLRKYEEFELYWHGAQSRAEQCGYRLVEFVCSTEASFQRLEDVLRARNILGILVPPQQGNVAKLLANLSWAHLCVVRLGYSVSALRSHVVTSDHVANASLAFERIRQKGYRRIGFVTSEGITTQSRGGYLLKQLDARSGTRLPVLFLPAGEAGVTTRRQLLENWMQRARPDAILTDVADLRQELLQLGTRVPDDVGLAALSVLDGNASAGIYQHSDQIGSAAVDLVVSLMQQRATGFPAVCRKILLEGSWVDGDTLPARVG